MISHHETSVSPGLLDAQPGLAAAATRNQGLAATEAEVAAAASDSATGGWCEIAKRAGSRIAADEYS